MNNNNWSPKPLYCPTCGERNIGYVNHNGIVKYQCSHCKTNIIHQHKSRRHCIINLYIPITSIQ